MNAARNDIVKRAVKQLADAGYNCAEISESVFAFNIMAVKPCRLRFIKILEAKDGWKQAYNDTAKALAGIPHCQNVAYEVWVYSDEYEWLKQEEIKEGVKSE